MLCVSLVTVAFEMYNKQQHYIMMDRFLSSEIILLCIGLWQHQVNESADIILSIKTSDIYSDVWIISLSDLVWSVWNCFYVRLVETINLFPPCGRLGNANILNHPVKFYSKRLSFLFSTITCLAFLQSRELTWQAGAAMSTGSQSAKQLGWESASPRPRSCFLTKKAACPLQSGGGTLPQVEEFKFRRFFFTSEDNSARSTNRSEWPLQYGWEDTYRYNDMRVFNASASLELPWKMLFRTESACIGFIGSYIDKIRSGSTCSSCQLLFPVLTSQLHPCWSIEVWHTLSSAVQ